MSYDSFFELRKHLDGQDPFMTTGHQIIKTRRPRKKKPDWINDNNRVKNILFSAFPRMHEDLKQRAGAGRWARVIHLYYRQSWTRGQIAAEMKITYDQVRTTIQSITRVSQGLRADGSGKKKRKNMRP